MSVKSERDRISSAYLTMADAGYRPEAPSDGFGGILLTDEQLRGNLLLLKESWAYADRFIKEEDEGGRFSIGISNYETNRALVYLIEASRLLCAGIADKLALKLIRMAQLEIKHVGRTT